MNLESVQLHGKCRKGDRPLLDQSQREVRNSLVVFVYVDNIHMINWAKIAGFDWDAGNSRKSVEKHGVSQAEAEQVFLNTPLVIVPDALHSDREYRLHALGQTDGERLLHVTFTLRAVESLIRVISARDMHRREKIRYEQEA